VGATAGNAASIPGAPADTPGVPSNTDQSVIQSSPTSLSFGMDGSLVVKDVHWTESDDQKFANATGTVEVNTCTPSCASGKYASQPANLVFRVVTSGDDPYFNCVRIDLPDGPVQKQFNASHLNLPLSAAAYSGTINCGPSSEAE
jgi:hypothetical protein